MEENTLMASLQIKTTRDAPSHPLERLKLKIDNKCRYEYEAIGTLTLLVKL